MENKLNIYSLIILRLQGIVQPLLIKCQQQLAPPTLPSAKSAFPPRLLTASSAAVYVFRILSSVYSLSQGALLSAVSENVLNVSAERKSARGLLVGRAEPCNHEQMTGLPSSASETLARFLQHQLTASLGRIDTGQLTNIVRSCRGLLGSSKFPRLPGTRFSDLVRGLSLPSLVTENP